MKDALNRPPLLDRIKWHKDCVRHWLNRKLFNPKTPAITDEEQLARFVLFSKHVVALDQRIKPDAFIPHPYPDLSVTRHLDLSDQQVWKCGSAIATMRKRTLYGRADLSAAIVRQQSLEIEPAPIEGNPNHANIFRWPADKPSQKIIAQQLAAASAYRSYAAKTP